MGLAFGRLGSGRLFIMQHTGSDSFRSPLGQARGLGSSKSGVSHWWFQRLTAVCLVPLTVWFVVWMLPLFFQAGPDALMAAFQGLEVAGPAMLWNICVFYHGALGLQVIVEDYIPSEFGKMVGIMLVKGLSVALMVVGNLAILKLFLMR